MQSENKVTAVGPTDGPCLAIGTGNYRIVISGEQTGGAYAVIDMVVPPGGGPGPHAHAGFQESFHILEGEVEVSSEEGTYTAVTGSFVNIPMGGIVHGFKNKSDKVARLWCVVVPAGLDAFFQEIGKPIAQGEFLPASPPGPEAMARLIAIGEKYGQKFYPPNYFDSLGKL
ncbi:MAG TPA: cupin domain-containing protein [Chitinophagales bacterium]|nr:cupin domain-containing protein [Chitinophagales bacterium]